MVIYLVGGFLILIRGDRGLSVGDISVMVTLLSRLYRPVNSLVDIQVDMVRSLALFSRIFDYLDREVEIESPPEARRIEDFSGRIDFEAVDFSYEKSKKILEGVSFSVPKGKLLALVGPSGAGKSTIINLLPRLYDVDSGAVKLDGVDIRELDLDFLRDKLGLVSQETYLFNASIRDNLLYARVHASQEDLEEACKKANIHDFIMDLPQGYDTPIGNRGVKLSGGEKQRLSIARALLKDPPIMLLDEATSSLDSISESLIQKALRPLLQGRTSIVIAYRLSTIMSADEILVVDGGRIVERGRPGELLEKDGLFRKLYDIQFREALEEGELLRAC